MQIEIAPETERLVQEEISSGHFRSVDELIAAGVQAWRERNSTRSEVQAQSVRPRNLVEVFEPVRGLFEEGELDFSRNKSDSRPVEFE